MQKRILQVTTVANTLNAFLLPFAKAFKEQGWQVDAAASNIFKFEQVVAEHNHCFDINFCRNPLKLKQLYQSLKQVRLLLKEQKYDVVHVHTPIAAFLTRIASVGIKQTKIFYTAHGFHYIKSNPMWKNILFYLAEKLPGLLTCHLFVINTDDYAFAIKNHILPKDKVTYIHGIGVNHNSYKFSDADSNVIRNELAISNDSFVLLQVAELNDNKNHRIVINAIALFKDKYPDSDIYYIVVGEGPLISALKEQVEALHLSKEVKFIGQRNDISKLLSACDILTLSSKREGLPRCILEAMCVNKPIIASKIRGCTDLLSTGAGILVDVDNAYQWFQAIELLYSNQKLCEEMGLIGGQLIEEQYQQEKIIDTVIKVYQREFAL